MLEPMTSLDDLDLFSKPSDVVPVMRPKRFGVTATPPDPVRQRTNRLNRERGKSTSAELAKYLGWQNVEGLNWPWDVQGPNGRLQSKRDATARSAAMVRILIERITAGDYLRGFFKVEPRQRLASGKVTLLLAEWQSWYGWDLPPTARLVNAGVPLLELGLPEFRDTVGSVEEVR